MLEIDRTTSPMSEQLWRNHAPELLRYATVLVGPTDAHDLVVDAFVRTAPRLADQHVEHPRAYLFRAVTNQANDLRRSGQRRWTRDLAAVGPASTAGPDTFVDVRRAVAELSLAQRSVVYFVYWHDLTEQGVADLLGLSPGTVHRHLDRARTHLRKALR
jgi:RNA polymerase sigma-70 factor (ECF subfamily)